ncbi:MAG TPA: hypothetical protein VGW38_07260, partial [Chloroflexota bacterium]|nr:hypothetical protein [Chloroflexota bacterium]
MVPGVEGSETIREAGEGLVLLDPAVGEGREFRVVLLREGLAKSRRYFTPEAVRQIAAAAEGLRAFADHPTPTEDRERPVRSITDMVGYYHDAGVSEVDGRVQAEATLHFFESAAWLAGLVREALRAGHAEIVGLSIDAVCVVNPGTPPGLGRPVAVVEQVLELKSTDIVTRPSAGGRFLTVQEAIQEAIVEEAQPVAGRAEVIAAMAGSREEARVDVVETGEPVEAAGGSGAGRMAEPEGLAVQEAQRVLDEVREAQRAFRCEHILTEHLAATDLPEPVRARLRRQWTYAPGKWGSSEEYRRALESALEMEAESLGELREYLLVAGRSGASATPSDVGSWSGGRALVSGMGAARVD